MNAILLKSEQVEFYTFLGPIFESIHNKQLDYNWLLTELELNYIPTNFQDYFDDYYNTEDGDDRYWLSGERLTKLVTDHEIQFIWGLLTAFPKDQSIDIRDLRVVPYVDSNPNFWKPGNSVQHPQGEIEIACWDSTLTLLISKDQQIVQDFRSVFTDAQDLDQYNRQFI